MTKYFVSAFILPKQSDNWHSSFFPLPPPLSLAPPASMVREAVTIKTPWKFPDQPCPMNMNNRDQWTKIEREKAAKCIVAHNLADLKAKVTYTLYFTIAITNILVLAGREYSNS